MFNHQIEGIYPLQTDSMVTKFPSTIVLLLKHVNTKQTYKHKTDNLYENNGTTCIHGYCIRGTMSTTVN